MMIQSRQKADLKEAGLCTHVLISIDTSIEPMATTSVISLPGPFLSPGSGCRARSDSYGTGHDYTVRGARSELHPMEWILGLSRVLFSERFPIRFSSSPLPVPIIQPVEAAKSCASFCKSRPPISYSVHPQCASISRTTQGVSPKDSFDMRIWLVSTLSSRNHTDATESSPCSWDSLTCSRRRVVRTFPPQTLSAFQGKPYGQVPAALGLRK